MTNFYHQTSPRQRIEAAAKLLSGHNRWTQGALARNARGKPTCFSRGVSFDVLGAVLHQGSQTERQMLKDGINNGMAKTLGFVQRAAHRRYKASAETVNDTTDHATVMDLLRYAWKLAGDSKDDRDD